MEQKQIGLNEIYEKLKKIEIEIEMINYKLNWERDFSEDENREFVEGTRKAWGDVDNNKYTAYDSAEEFLLTFKGKNASKGD